MRRIGGALIAALALFVWTTPRCVGPEAPRFAEVTLRILSMGERQPLKEIGVFSSSLPLGRAGGLRRMLTISNETKNTSTTLLLGLSVTPSLDDQGVLHCVVVSEAAPKDADPVRRAKDMAFGHPGEQVMELLADSSTGSRVTLAVSAALAVPKASESKAAFPPVTFLVRVEQWNGAQRVEIENIQLQSLDGARVTHDYERKVPRWVDADAPEAGDRDALSLDNLPVLDTTSGNPTIKAGEGFSIQLTPKEQEKQRKAAAKETARQGGDSNLLPEASKNSEPPKKIVWDREFYKLTIEPMAFHGDELFVKMTMQGQIMDPSTKTLAPPQDFTTEKSLGTGQPTPFYLTRDGAGGATGYVAWVLPRWSAVVPPEGISETPPQPIPQAFPPKERP